MIICVWLSGVQIWRLCFWIVFAYHGRSLVSFYPKSGTANIPCLLSFLCHKWYFPGHCIMVWCFGIICLSWILRQAELRCSPKLGKLGELQPWLEELQPWLEASHVKCTCFLQFRYKLNSSETFQTTPPFCSFRVRSASLPFNILSQSMTWCHSSCDQCNC